MKRFVGVVAAMLVAGGCRAETWVNDADWTCDGVSCRVPKATNDDQHPADG